MHSVGYTAAVFLAVVFAWAAVAKLAGHADTARTFAALRLPPGAATAVPVVELGLAVALVVVPGWAAVVALALLAAFSTFLLRAVRSGVTAPCNCFGSARRAPVSSVELVRNGLLAVAAAVALTADHPTVPGAGAIAALVLAVAFSIAMLRARTPDEGPPIGTAAPALPGVEWSDTTVVAFFAPRCPRCGRERELLDEGAFVLDLDDRTRPLFEAYRVRATPYYVVVDATGVVRWRGAELSAAQRAR